MKKILFFGLGVFLTIVIALVTYYIMDISKNKKTAYVELAKVYNDFQMKKELEAKLNNIEQARKTILDSLKISLNALSMEIKSEKDKEAIQKFQIKKSEYLAKQQNFENDNQATTKRYSDQIWQQINQYVKDYGIQNKYSTIFGADGSGNLLYADEKMDITNEISKYINDRYNGQKK